jgi:phenylalanyl-tRNA synthetase beta chain
VAQEEEAGGLMPVIEISASDLKGMLGREVADSELETVLPLNKLEIEEWDRDRLKIEVTPDRPDLMCTEGIARQVSAWLGIRRGLPSHVVSKPIISMTASPVKVRPCIVAGAVRGLKLDDDTVRSIMQLQELIDLTIGRDRVKTAIGVHDVSKVKPPFCYKEVDPKTVSFVPLGFKKEMTMEEILRKHPKGIQYKHIFGNAKKLPIILDKNGDILSFPPIINGELTKVTEGTKDIFLDITGYDEAPISYGLNILLTSMEMRGGRIEAVKVNKKTYPSLRARSMKLDTGYVKRMLGCNLKDSEIKSLLERMNYGVNMKNRTVLIPPYRYDILHFVDIIEDISIAYGYNDFEPELPRLPTVGRPHPFEEFCNRVREMMIGTGFQEVVNYTLTSPEKQFKLMGVPERDAVEIANPMSKEFSQVRVWAIPSLMANLVSNKHRRYPQRLFEVADCVIPDPKQEVRTRNIKKLAGVVGHANANFSEMAAIMNSIDENLGLKTSKQPSAHPSFMKGRCGQIMKGSKPIGIFGEISPAILSRLTLKMPVTAFELELDEVYKHK